jgi:DNA-binding IclR family transcriptional regulator
MPRSTPITEETALDHVEGNGNGNGGPEDDAGGVQAVDTAVRVLSALVDTGAPLMLKTVAERADMQPPKAHRYLVSFCRQGLAERDPASGGYRLGPLAVRIGLAALRRLNVVQVASPTLVDLRDELGFTAGLAVWGAAGPTFVRFEETHDALIISGRPGSVMPMLTSSTGRVFGAYLPRALTWPLIERELAGARHPGATPTGTARGMTPADVEAIFADVRTHKLARIEGLLNPGLHGLSAPVFDHAGAVVGVITVLGPAGLIDTRLDGTVAAVLSARAAEASARMGWA